jgi:hypothetical protein
LAHKEFEMSEGTEVAFRYDGMEILFDRATGMGSLTTMWRAKGQPANKQPAQWMRTQQAQELTRALADRLAKEAADAQSIMQKCTIDPASQPQLELAGPVVVETRTGNSGGTWAHWQIAAAYAHYLDPAFYLTWNEWAVAHITGAPVAPASDLEARIAALEARVGGGINTAHATPATPRPTHYTLPVAPSVQRMRVDHPSAVAILGVLRESAAPLSAKQVCLVLTERGQTTHDTKYFTVCLRRLECAGAVRRVAYGLYEAAQTIEIPPRLPEGRLMGWDD